MGRVLVSVGLLALLGVGAYLYPPARLMVLVLAGRSPACPMANAVRADQHRETLTIVKDRILAASQRVERTGGLELWETPYGPFWIPEGNQFVLPFNLAEQELEIYGQDSLGVRPGDIVLDCGANVGAFARAALRAGARTVVAIEPAPVNLECLRRNFASEIEAGSLILYPKGVWDRQEELPLLVDPHNLAAASVVLHHGDARESGTVSLTTIDALAAELDLSRVDFIKLDIEGAEQKALAGARETIARYRPRLAVSAYHQPDDPQRIPEIVREAWPAYTMECGPCSLAGNWIRPDILYFY
ncbi:MAG: FkbM family methyltransferase [Bryobacterales bacterium]|jgi:FkbM family methyltransferase|nr:FkbM family methyltransferase [Bryobacterales bacterium]